MDLAWCLPWAFVLGFSVTGCGLGGIEVIANGYNCAHPDKGFIDPATGIPDPCHERTPWPEANDQHACPGPCVLEHRPFFDGPALTWIGPKGQGPPCPLEEPSPAWIWYADLETPPLCPACTCDPPTGSCRLPETITAHAATCQNLDPTTPQMSFDPPTGWNGTCTTENPVPAGTQCPGGADCAQSLTLDTLTVNEVAKCTPRPIQMPGTGAAPYFKTEARWCPGPGLGECGGGQVCMPPVPPEFRICEARQGNHDCNPERFPEKHTVFEAIGQDLRQCTDCDCESPAGSVCTGCIATYSDKTCSMMNGCYDVRSGGLPSVCIDLPLPGAALFSKQRLNITYTPGMCQPIGGIETGDVETLGEVTLCCLPLPSPPR